MLSILSAHAYLGKKAENRIGLALILFSVLGVPVGRAGQNIGG